MLLAPDGRILLRHHAQQPVQTGSLMKLLLTLGVLETLGPAFRFHTDLLADPRPGVAGQPAWQLAFRGGGDPDLRQEDLRQMLRVAEGRGMHRVSGPVVLDDQRFAPVTLLGQGIQAEADRSWATLPGALQVDHAAVHLVLPADAPQAWLAEPGLAGSVQWTNAGSAAEACPSDWAGRLHLQVVGDGLPGPTAGNGAGTADVQPAKPGRLVLRGIRPAGCGSAEIWRSPLPARDHFAWTLASLWTALGHHDTLVSVPGAAPSYARISVRHDSRPLAELVRGTNKFSNNLMARTLLLDLAAESGDLPATPAGGIAALRAWLSAHQLDFPELVLENGAGLSHGEVLSAEHLAAVLRYSVTSAVAPEFLASLPIPGQDGTLSTRLAGHPLAPRMRLKTGSLDGVRGLAGLVAAPGGGHAVVVCVVNAPQVGDVTALQAAVLDYLTASW